MSHTTKSFIYTNSGNYRLVMTFLSVLVLLFMTAPLIIPVKANALSINDVTSGVNKALTMGKSTPAPVYTPAPSNAPSSATNPPAATATSPAATNATSTGSATATKASATDSKAPVNTTIDSPTKYSGSEASSQPNLYKVTQLTANQNHLAQNILRSSLTIGTLLVLIALIVFGLQFSRARNHIDQPVSHKPQRVKV